jgi:hypothetical protein
MCGAYQQQQQGQTAQQQQQRHRQLQVQLLLLTALQQRQQQMQVMRHQRRLQALLEGRCGQRGSGARLAPAIGGGWVAALVLAAGSCGA